MNSKVDFLYLSEKDAIKAGVSDMHKCIEIMIEMFGLISKGDYVMGGKNQNSHGQKLFFPERSEFENMPVKGPDRRFMSLIAYLGGRFNVCGQKWYGSNVANREKGLPRSILTVMLNDADTGAPLCLMSANMLSSVRTGAVPGVGAKFLANEDSEAVGLIGCGIINRASILAILDVCKNINTVKVYSRYKDSADSLCAELSEKFKVKAFHVDSVEEAVRNSDIINVATSGSAPPRIEEEWLKDGVLISLPAAADLSKEFILRTKIVVDNWKMYEAYAAELDGLPGGYSRNQPGISGLIMDYVMVEKILPVQKIINLGDIAANKVKARSNKKEKIILVTDGMAAEDVAWGYHVYQNALRLGIGVRLNLFE